MSLLGEILYQEHITATGIIPLPMPDWTKYQEQIVLSINIVNVTEDIDSKFILHCSKNAGTFNSASMILPNAYIRKAESVPLCGKFPIRDGQQWAYEAEKANVLTLTMWGVNRTR
jgi:hypothetical protein